jgi:hypothetical protein
MPAPTVSEDEDGGEVITPDGTPVPAARAAFECFKTRRSFAMHVSTLRGLWKVDFAMPTVLKYLLCLHLLSS